MVPLLNDDVGGWISGSHMLKVDVRDHLCSHGYYRGGRALRPDLGQ